MSARRQRLDATAAGLGCRVLSAVILLVAVFIAIVLFTAVWPFH